jgi:hypothetical protein
MKFGRLTEGPPKPETQKILSWGPKYAVFFSILALMGNTVYKEALLL